MMFADFREFDEELERDFWSIMDGEMILKVKRDERVTFSFNDSDARDIYNAAIQIGEAAKNGLVARGYNARYNISKADFAIESDGAHTNLVKTIASQALSFIYGADFGNTPSNFYTEDKYTYREIMETIQIHDLPENVIGDIPDNGSCNEEMKIELEHDYFQKYAETYSTDGSEIKLHAYELFEKMKDPSSPTGRLVFLSDKLAATIAVLTYEMLLDDVGEEIDAAIPRIAENDPTASVRDKEEMAICENFYNPFNEKDAESIYRFASEMWTIDFLKVRRFTVLDETLFFTAVLVMYTLITDNDWYGWRREDYRNGHLL